MRHDESFLEPTSSRSRRPRLLPFAIASAVALALTGCGGGSSAVTPTPEAIRQDGPTAPEVTVAFSISATPEQGDTPPQSTIDIVLTGSDGQVVRATVAEYPAACLVQEAPEGSDVITTRCWWAGAGLSIHAIHDGDDLVVRKLQIYEEAAEDMSEAIETHRFALSAGARVYETPAH